MTAPFVQLERPVDDARGSDTARAIHGLTTGVDSGYRAADRPEVLAIARPGVVLLQLLIAGAGWWSVVAAARRRTHPAARAVADRVSGRRRLRHRRRHRILCLRRICRLHHSTAATKSTAVMGPLTPWSGWSTPCPPGPLATDPEPQIWSRPDPRPVGSRQDEPGTGSGRHRVRRRLAKSDIPTFRSGGKRIDRITATTTNGTVTPMSRASTTDLPVQAGPAPIVLAWRTAIAALAWWGLLAALHGDISQLRYFSQVTTLTVALTATASVLTFAVRSPALGHGPGLVPRRLDDLRRGHRGDLPGAAQRQPGRDLQPAGTRGGAGAGGDRLGGLRSRPDPAAAGGPR